MGRLSAPTGLYILDGYTVTVPTAIFITVLALSLIGVGLNDGEPKPEQANVRHYSERKKSAGEFGLGRYCTVLDNLSFGLDRGEPRLCGSLAVVNDSTCPDGVAAIHRAGYHCQILFKGQILSTQTQSVCRIYVAMKSR